MAACYGIITDTVNAVATVVRTSYFHHLSERFDRQPKHIADAAQGLDHARCIRIGLQFAPQPQDLNINASIENIFVNSGGLQQMLPRLRPLRCLEKGQQQRVLALAHRDRDSVGVEQPAAAPIKLPAIEPVSASLRIMARATRPVSCRRNMARTRGQQLPEAERLYDVVVRPQFKVGGAIDFVGTMSARDDDRWMRTWSVHCDLPGI